MPLVSDHRCCNLRSSNARMNTSCDPFPPFEPARQSRKILPHWRSRDERGLATTAKTILNNPFKFDGEKNYPIISSCNSVLRSRARRERRGGGGGGRIRFIYFQFTELKVFERVNTCTLSLWKNKKQLNSDGRRGGRRRIRRDHGREARNNSRFLNHCLVSIGCRRVGVFGSWVLGV